MRYYHSGNLVIDPLVFGRLRFKLSVYLGFAAKDTAAKVTLVKQIRDELIIRTASD